MRTRNVPILAASLALAAAANAGVVVFDNFDVGNNYNCCSGATISGINSPIGADNDQGMGFVPATGGKIESIDIAMGFVTGSNDFTLQLWNDSGGLPGTMLSSWHVVNQMPGFGSTGNQPVNIINSDPNAVVNANSAYYLIASTADDTWAAWNGNSIGDSGPIVAQVNNGGFQAFQGERGAFRVTLAVPAPGSAGLLGLAGLAAARRRR